MLLSLRAEAAAYANAAPGLDLGGSHTQSLGGSSCWLLYSEARRLQLHIFSDCLGGPPKMDLLPAACQDKPGERW